MEIKSWQTYIKGYQVGTAVTGWLAMQDMGFHEKWTWKLIRWYDKGPNCGRDYVENQWDSITIKICTIISTVKYKELKTICIIYLYSVQPSSYRQNPLKLVCKYIICIRVKGHIKKPYKTTSKMIILYLYLPWTQCFEELYKEPF